MNRYILGCLAVITALSVSCKDNEEKPGGGKDNPPAPSGHLSIAAELAPLGSLQPVWSAGDRISVFSKNGAPVAFSLSGEPGAAIASFAGDLEGIAAGDTIFACHPFVEGCPKTAVPVDMTSQVSVPGVIAPADVTVASGIFIDPELAPDLAFEHILGGITFNVDNKNIWSQPVTSLGVVSEGIVLSGTYNLVSGELAPAASVAGSSILSLQGESVEPWGKSSWILSMIPQTLPEGSKVFIELAPGDTLFKTLSRTQVKKDKLLDIAFTVEPEGLSVKSVIAPFLNVADVSVTFTPLWAPSDKYGVFSGEKNFNVPFTITGESGSAEAGFLGYPDLLIGDELSACYPYSGSISEEGELSIDLSVQDLTSDSHLAPSDIAVAQGKVSEETILTFNHVLGGILFEVTNTSDTNPIVIASVSLSSESISLSGSYNILSGELKSGEAAAGELLCNTAKSLAPGETGSFFMSVLPQEISAGTVFSVSSVTGDSVSLNLDESIEIEAGEYFSVSLGIEGERGGAIHDLGSCAYDTDGSVLWTSPALSIDGNTAYVTSSNYKLAAISLTGEGLSATPDWVVDAKEAAGMASGGSIVTSTPAVSSTGIYALLGKGIKASLVKVLPNGTLDYYRLASYYVNGNTSSPDPASVEFEFDMECPIIFPTSDVYAERVLFSMQSNGDYKRFVSARGCGNPDGSEDTKQGGSRQTSKGTTTNLGGVMGYVGSDGWYFMAGRTSGNTVGAQVIKTNTSGGSMSGDTSASHLLGYVATTETVSNGRGSQMSQDANHVYYIAWNSAPGQYPDGNTLLFRYSKSKIKPSTTLTPDYIIALKGGVSPESASGMRGVGSVLSADGSVLYVTTCQVKDGEGAYVHAVNTADGSVKWSREAGDIQGVAAVDDLGNIYFIDRDSGCLVQLDPQTGAVTEQILLGSASSSPTIGPGGIIWCNTLNSDGHPTLRAFSIKGSNGPAKGWSQLGGNPQKSGTAY